MTDTPPSDGYASGVQHQSDSTEGIQLRYLFTLDGDEPREVLEIVCDLAIAAGAELFLGVPVTVPEQTPLNAEEPQLRGERLTAKYVPNAESRCGNELPDVNGVVRIGHQRNKVVAGMVDTHGITTLIEETIPESGLRTIFGGEFDERGVEETCDVITVSRITQLESIDSILVPIAAGPHSGFAIDIAVSLARQNDATIELLHVEDKSEALDERVGKQVLARGDQRAKGFDAVSRTLLEAESVSETVVEYSKGYDITVMGAPRKGRLKQFVSETIPSEVSPRAEGTVLTGHRAGVESSWLDHWV
jgi:nucleotide-binding universal stress UspA family protein